MKQLFAILFLLMPCCVSAQDVIVKKDRSRIDCRVEEVTETEISYTLWGDESETCYLIDKSLVRAIIHENGQRETFGKKKKALAPEKRPAFDPKKPYKKVKRLKIIGWIGGGVLTSFGIVCLATGIRFSNLTQSDGIGLGIQDRLSGGMVGIGAACIGTGAVFTTAFYIAANEQKKKIDAAMQTSSLYRYNIPLRGCSSLSVGVDLMNDRIMNRQTVGLGLCYHF